MNSPNMLCNAAKQIKVGNYCKSKLIRNTAYVLYFKNSFSAQNSETQELVTKEKIQITKPTVTKWKRPPFVKNFFLGKFDTELLAFPEILDHELLAEVEKYIKPLNELYMQKVNSRQIDETGKIPEDLLQDLKALGLFGRMMPTKYGGLDLSYTACTRLNEVIGLDWSLYSFFTVHEFLASRAILLFGSETQKDKYLPLLATGKKIAAFCAVEPQSGSELISISSMAISNPEGNYVIDGTKCWVSNADIADYFIVFAKSPSPAEKTDPQVSAFIVDKNSDGISISPHEKVCLRGVKTSVVKFREVSVPKENLISVEGCGCQIYLKVLEDFRIMMNSFTFGTLKALLDSVTERVINTERFENCLGDLQLVRRRLSKITARLYAMESISYFTAAILDSTENPDVALESAAMKIFNGNGTLFCIRELMDIVGATSLMKEQHLERFHRDALGLRMFDLPDDVLKLFIGYAGCQVFVDREMEEITKLKNRIFLPSNTVKLQMRKLRDLTNRLKFDQDLAGHLHPSLVKWGNRLEEKLQKFEVAMNETLNDHQGRILETQLDPRIIAECAILIYAQAAVLSRASRSYCIGLKNAHHEIDLAGVFCFDADQIIYDTVDKLFIRSRKGNEEILLMTGSQIIDCRGYFPEHPLKLSVNK